VAELATSTGGAYVEAVASHEDIDAMIKEMHAKTDRKTLKEEEMMQYIPLFQYPLALAMMLFLIATSSISKREKVTAPHAFVLFALLSTFVPLQAALMDFKLLDEASQRYEAEDYNQSAALYEDYASRMKDPEAFYNSANALYKQGDYKNAQKMYQKVFSDDEELTFNTLHNLGNSYAKESMPESLQSAVESYEKALKIKDDAQTQENLQRVKEALEKLKQEQQQENQDKEQKEKQEQKEQQKQESQDQKEQQKSDKNAQDKKGDDAKKDDKQESSEGSEKKEEQKQAKEQEAKAQQEQKSHKDEEKKEKQPAKAEATENDKIMSDLEEQKWLNELNQKRAGHMYQLQQLENKNEKSYEKPW
jgi:Ca-activated chloride channel family protein